MSAQGTWDITLDTPMGKQRGRLVLNQTADGAWEGTSLNHDSGEESALTDINVAGTEVTWKQTMTKPMKLNVKCTVTIKGDKLSGRAKAGMFPSVPMKGKRAA